MFRWKMDFDPLDSLTTLLEWLRGLLPLIKDNDEALVAIVVLVALQLIYREPIATPPDVRLAFGALTVLVFSIFTRSNRANN